MATKTLHFEITGTAPLIVHNAQLSDPLNDFAMSIAEISKKRKKTHDDLIEMARREFMGSLYIDEVQGEDLGPIMPGANLERMLIDAAKKFTMGPKAKAGLVVPDDEPIPIQYDGPRDPEKLWADERFPFRASCKVGQSRVIRCRPRFRDWKIKFPVMFDTSMLNKSNINEFMEMAANMIGLGDWRPKHGRFTWKEVKA